MSEALLTKGTNLVNASGQPILLQGTHLAGWLSTADWLTGWKKKGKELNEYKVWEILADRFSSEQAAALRRTYRRHWIQKTDLEAISTLGFNTIRVPFSLTKRKKQLSLLRLPSLITTILI
ncbi:MAG: hypothetical protein AABX13_03175 [Nanoarchaeota archaeon]